MDPGLLLRSVRERNGLTQAEVAARAGTSQPVVSAYEHGRRGPTVAMLERLVGAAGGQLTLGARHPAASDLVPPSSPEEHARRLLDVLSLADAIPRRRRAATLEMPRLVSR